MMYHAQDKQIGLLLVANAGSKSLFLQHLLQGATRVNILGVFSHFHAKNQIKRLQPQVVILDIDQAPEEAFSLLEYIGQHTNIPVILWGQFSQTNNSEIYNRALRLGAVDFLRKPPLENEKLFREELLKKVYQAGQMASQTHRLQLRKQQKSTRPLGPLPEKGPFPNPTARLLVIGASTGGPRALQEIFSTLPVLPLPVLIVQHMPSAVLTQSLTERLNSLSAMPVKEVSQGERLQASTIYVAPGDFHVELNAELRASLNQKPLHCSVRPSIDITLFSLLKHLDGNILSVILTGMGQDGLEGIQRLKAHGGRCLAEDKSTCVVYGMPRMIVEHQLADAVVPLHQMAAEICQQLIHWTPSQIQ